MATMATLSRQPERSFLFSDDHNCIKRLKNTRGSKILLQIVLNFYSRFNFKSKQKIDKSSAKRMINR